MTWISGMSIKTEDHRCTGGIICTGGIFNEKVAILCRSGRIKRIQFTVYPAIGENPERRVEKAEKGLNQKMSE
jgi:hypothetical protein